MKKYLLLVFLLPLAKQVCAQDRAIAGTSVTVVHPVGTAEAGEEPAGSVLRFGGDDQAVSATAEPFIKTKATGVKKIRVISDACLYAVAVLPYATVENRLQKLEAQDCTEPLLVASLANGIAFCAGNGLNRAGDTLLHPLPDVAIHFN